MPFGRATFDDKYYKTLASGNLEFYFSKVGASNFSSEFKDLIHKMLSFDQNERISIEEIKRHPWMNIQVNDEYQKEYLRSLIKME